MWRLEKGYQQSGPNRPQVGNLSQQPRRSMFPALGQQLPPGFLAQELEHVELSIESLRPTTRGGMFCNHSR
jgi:hypothetical protein